jgi:hypothetical protein
MVLPEHVQIGQLPQSAEEFITLRDQIATTPHGGAAAMVTALLLYAADEQLGLQCLTIAVDRDRLEAGTTGYRGWQLRRREMQRIETQIKAGPHIPRSYIHGATPENGYMLPALPYVLAFSDNPYSGDPDSGTYKLFVSCSGASSPRPVTVKRNDRGIWKAHEWSSLISGVKAPARSTEDDL